MPWVETRLVCKMEGCTNPPHRYPNGTKAAYCKEHIRFRKGKFRGDIHMTGPMSVVLAHLAEQKQGGTPFTTLPQGTDKRTVKALIDRDWMIESKGLDGMRYKITGRGIQALKTCAGQYNRRDGICPHCGERPRHVRKSGKKDAYCKQCLSEIGATKRRKHGGRFVNPQRGCSRCGSKPLLRYSSGQYCTYCASCEHERLRIKNEKAHLKELEIIRTGQGIPLCARCHQKPVKVFTHSVGTYCNECAPIMARRWKLRRVLNNLGVLS